MIYIMAAVFIIVCVASVCYNKGVRKQYHDRQREGEAYEQ